MQLRVRVHKLINNKDRCSSITLRVKRRGQLIVRLKAIKSREDTFRYLSSYLHRSFLWHLVIIHLLHHQVVRPNAETSGCIVSRTFACIVALSDCLQSSNHLQPSNHRGFELSFILYITHPMPAGNGRNRDCNRSRYYYLVWELFKWSFLLYHLINRKLSLLKYERSKTWFTALMNHALTSDHLPGSICVHPLDHLELRLDLLPSPPHREDGPPPHREGLVEADVDVPRVRPGRVQPAVSLTAHRGSSSGFPL